MPGFVTAYNKKTKKVRRVPDHWVGHPTLGPDLTLEVPKNATVESTVVTADPATATGTGKTTKKENGNAEDHR